MLGMEPLRKHMLKQLMARVAICPETECWLFTGAKSNGYGHLKAGGRWYMAHRLSYELHRGPIPKGLNVLHNCPGGDNRACINPAHLWLGTQRDNIRDACSKGTHTYQPGFRDIYRKLTEADVRQIRSLLSSVSGVELARRFNVNRRTIWKIKSGRTWRDLD